MTRRYSVTLALTAAAALALASPPPATAGVHFEQTVSSTGAGQGLEMRVRGWAEGPNAKIEYVESNNQIMPVGSYLLTTDGGETVYLVDPDEQTYSEWDLSQAFAMLGQLEEMSGGMMKFDFEDPESETLLTETGGEILGYPTTHHRWRSAYTMVMEMPFMNRRDRTVTVTDAWVTDAIQNPGLSVWLRAMPTTTGDPELDEHLTNEMRRLDGIALKLEQKTTTTSKKGQERRSTTRFEVTTLREESVPDSRFQMPSDYSEVPLAPTAQQNRAGETTDSDDDDPVKALEGLFGGGDDDD